MAEKQSKQGQAFRILHSFNTMRGKRYRKGVYVAKNQRETEELEKSQFALPVAQGEAQAAAAPAASAAPPEPQESEEPGEEEPDWSFQTIKAMRSWLDSSGVELPAPRAGKQAHEDLCVQAWKAGARTHPLYGLPGGPAVSPGLPFSVDRKSFQEALDAARQAEIPVPAETLAAFEALVRGETAPESPSAGAGEPNAAPSTETSDQGNEGLSEPESAEKEPEGEPALPGDQAPGEVEVTTHAGEAVPSDHHLHPSGSDGPGETAE